MLYLHALELEQQEAVMMSDEQLMEEQKQILAQIEEEKQAQDQPPPNLPNRENSDPVGREAVAIDWQMPESNTDDIDTDEEICGLPQANEPK